MLYYANNMAPCPPILQQIPATDQYLSFSCCPAHSSKLAAVAGWDRQTDRETDRQGDRQTERWTVWAVPLTKITGPLTLAPLKLRPYGAIQICLLLLLLLLLYLNQALRNVELTLAQKVLYDDAVNILSSLFAFKCLVDIDCIEVRSEVLQNNEQECV